MEKKRRTRCKEHIGIITFVGEKVCELNKKGELTYWADKAQLKRLREAAIIDIEEKKRRAKGTGGRPQLPPIQDIIQTLPPDQQ